MEEITLGELSAGTVLKNRYRIQHRLGYGGMGVVYRALDKGNGDEVVAVKQCRLTIPEARAAFEHEARILADANLHHPHLPEVKDTFTEHEQLYIVMAFIEGKNLEEMMNSDERFSVSHVLDWADQILGVLDHLHSQSSPVIHRDIKPKNLILSPNGTMYLVDFGIAKSSEETVMRGTASTLYASPEQLYGQGTDARSDLYSLSVTLYYLLSDTPPPNANERQTAMQRKKSDPIRPLQKLNPNVSPEVSRVIAKGMALEPAERYSSASEMRNELSRARWSNSGKGNRSLTFWRGVGAGVALLLLVQVLGFVLAPCWFERNSDNWQRTIVETKAEVFGGPPPPSTAPCPTIRFYGDRKGTPGARLDQMLAQRFTDATCINVEVSNPPQEERFPSTEVLNTHDVIMVDLIWTGALAPQLVDLNQTTLKDAALLHSPEIIANNTINGRLIAMPFFRDVGMLYYRTDLLQKHGYDNPPETWRELETMARNIVAQENDSMLTGFIWQGSAYEGATCNALEWLVSSGAISIDRDGQVSFPEANDERIVQTLNRSRQWIGTISPGDVLRFTEVESHEYFRSGHAVFMRLWPYAYSLMNEEDSPVRGKFAATVLPHDPGFPSVGVVGGWQIAVPLASTERQAAIEFLTYLTSPDIQRWRAHYGYLPTIISLANDPEVQEHIPFLDDLEPVVPITRPSSTLGERYPDASRCFYSSIHRILLKQPAGDLASQEIVPEITECFSQ
jgi:trehalose/maltose transport system substrate-binding protein